MKLIKKIIKNIILVIYIGVLKLEVFLGRLLYKPQFDKGRILFAAPVGRAGKENYIKYIKEFSKVECDFMLFSYDDAEFNEREFDKVEVIKAKGLKWDFAYKYITPDICKNYDYIFYWDDDLEFADFSISQFISIMKRNRLSIAQPSLTRESYYSHLITLQTQMSANGRYTNFVEIMCPAYSRKAWLHLWGIMNQMPMGEGLGYDLISWPPFLMRGIVDAQVLRHTKKLRTKGEKSLQEHEEFKKRFTSFPMKRMKFVNLGVLT